jgi:hypothetical protein
MQSPQATHLTSNSPLSTEPGGRTGAGRAGIPGSETGAKPPSVVFSTASAAANKATPLSVSLRVAHETSRSASAGRGSPLSDAAGFPKQALHPSQPFPGLWAQRVFRESRANKVPAGHIQLHQKRPLPIAAKTATTQKRATPGTKSVNVLPYMEYGVSIQPMAPKPVDISTAKTDKMVHLTIFCIFDSDMRVQTRRTFEPGWKIQLTIDWNTPRNIRRINARQAE